MENSYAVDTVFGDDHEVHGVMSWHELQGLLQRIIEDGNLKYLEIDETTARRGVIEDTR